MLLVSVRDSILPIFHSLSFDLLPKMEFPFEIKEFSAWFCLVFAAGESSFEQKFGSLRELPKNTKRIKDIIIKLHEMYREEMHSTFYRINVDLNTKPKRYAAYMKAVLSKCLELSNPPDELHFFLVCTFIYGIILARGGSICLMFAQVAALCLIAVYERRYKILLDSKSFESYCKTFNTNLERKMTAKGRKTLEPFNQEELKSLMADLKVLGDENLPLLSGEKDMLFHIQKRIPKNDYTTDSDDASSMEEETSNETSASEESSACELTVNPNEDETLCKHCFLNCFEYASTFLREVFGNN